MAHNPASTQTHPTSLKQQQINSGTFFTNDCRHCSRGDTEKTMGCDCKFCFTQWMCDQTTLDWHIQDLGLTLPVKTFQIGPSASQETQITPFSLLWCFQSIKWRRSKKKPETFFSSMTIWAVEASHHLFILSFYAFCTTTEELSRRQWGICFTTPAYRKLPKFAPNSTELSGICKHKCSQCVHHHL